MGGKIDCYLDLASLYSYLAFLELQRNLDLLASHNVEVEYHPVLLGAINAGSGNKPPWTLPAKAIYGTLDARRSIARQQHHLNLYHNSQSSSHSTNNNLLPLPLKISFPKNLFKSGRTIPALRSLHYIKHHFPTPTFHLTLQYLFHIFWAPPNGDLTTLEGVGKALSEVPSPEEKGKLFTQEEVKQILEAAQTEEIKGVLKNVTQEALDKGAFGAPWMWVSDGKGGEEAFFGSDRFHFMYEFLGVPYQDIQLLPAGGEKGKL